MRLRVDSKGTVSNLTLGFKGSYKVYKGFLQGGFLVSGFS